MALQVKQAPDGSISTDIDELIREGHVTTNLEKLRAKSANFYIIPWQEVDTKKHVWDFAPANSLQQSRLEIEDERAYQQGSSAAAEPVVEEADGDAGNDNLMDRDFAEPLNIPEEKITYDEPISPETIVAEADGELPAYSGLSDDAKAALTANGISENMYNNPDKTPGMVELIKLIIGCK